jgi:hypothetical protein
MPPVRPRRPQAARHLVRFKHFDFAPGRSPRSTSWSVARSIPSRSARIAGSSSPACATARGHRTRYRPGPSRRGRIASKRCLLLGTNGWSRSRHPPRSGGPFTIQTGSAHHRIGGSRLRKGEPGTPGAAPSPAGASPSAPLGLHQIGGNTTVQNRQEASHPRVGDGATRPIETGRFEKKAASRRASRDRFPHGSSEQMPWAQLRVFEPLTSCMPCRFGPSCLRRPGAGVQLIDPHGLTVVDRWIPLVPAAYGMRVARMARTTMARTWRRRLPTRP